MSHLAVFLVLVVVVDNNRCPLTRCLTRPKNTKCCRPHPHQRRREKQSKLGGAALCWNNSSVHIAHTKQRDATSVRMGPGSFFRVTRRVASSVHGAEAKEAPNAVAMH